MYLQVCKPVHLARETLEAHCCPFTDQYLCKKKSDYLDIFIFKNDTIHSVKFPKWNLSSLHNNLQCR